MNWLDPGFAVVPRVAFAGNVRQVGEADSKALRRAYHRAYYHAVYKEKRKVYHAMTKERDRAKRSAWAKERYWRNAEKSRAEARARAKLRYDTDPEYRERVRAKSATRRAMLRGAA